MSIEPPDESETLADEMRASQRNTLPHELLAQDHLVDEVLWHGPRKRSKIQTAGMIVIGGVLLLCGLADVMLFWQKGARLMLLPMLAICGFGARILYKSVRPSRL